MDDRYESGNARYDRESVGRAFLDNVYLTQRMRDYRCDEFNLFEGRGWPYSRENDYLTELSEWDRAPMTQVYNMLSPDFVVVDVRRVSDEVAAKALEDLVCELRRLHHEIIYADHLSDRRLYRLIVKYVLPSELKALKQVQSPVYWNFCSYTETEDYDFDEEIESKYVDLNCAREQNWLVYYATDLERRHWKQTYRRELPEKARVLHARPYLCHNVTFH